MRPPDLGEKPIIGFPIRSSTGVVDVLIFYVAIGRLERRKLLILRKIAATGFKSISYHVSNPIGRESAIKVFTNSVVGVTAGWDVITPRFHSYTIGGRPRRCDRSGLETIFIVVASRRRRRRRRNPNKIRNDLSVGFGDIGSRHRQEAKGRRKQLLHDIGEVSVMQEIIN